jgi:hypothetical protein
MEFIFHRIIYLPESNTQQQSRINTAPCLPTLLDDVCIAIHLYHKGQQHLNMISKGLQCNVPLILKCPYLINITSVQRKQAQDLIPTSSFKSQTKHSVDKEFQVKSIILLSAIHIYFWKRILEACKRTNCRALQFPICVRGTSPCILTA